MPLTPQITFRDMQPTDAVSTVVNEKVAKLERLFDRISRCDVMIEAPHRHQHKGRLFHVRVHLNVPGGEIIVGRDPDKSHAHEDVYVAIRDAFDATKRQLLEYAERRRGDVKKHDANA
jgi:ribosomal subunit interface protein